MIEKKKKWTKKRIVRWAVFILIIVLVYQPVYAELLKNAIRNNDVQMTKVILSIPGNVDFRFSAPAIEVVSHTALEVACKDDNYEIMELLLEHGAKPSYEPGHAQPLSYILQGNYIGLFDRTKLLIEYGAEINIGDGSGRQPIESLFSRLDYLDELTLEDANAEVFATMVYLAEQGVRFESNYPRITFHYLYNTVKNDNYKATEYLVLEQGLDVNMVGTGDSTLLIYVAKDGKLKAAELLLELGIDKSTKDEEGKTAYDYAVENGHLKLAELLKP